MGLFGLDYPLGLLHRSLLRPLHPLVPRNLWDLLHQLHLSLHGQLGLSNLSDPWDLCVPWDLWHQYLRRNQEDLSSPWGPAHQEDPLHLHRPFHP